MSTPLGLDSDITDPVAHAAEGRKFLGEFEENVVFGGLARPLNDILIDAKSPPQIDFLSLDVEGAEIEVLKGINHDEYRFMYMLIENRSIDKLNNYLEPLDYGYVEKFSHWDYLYKNLRD